ncbi:Methionine aminopeptidase 1D, chloroplastic/mitochondrial, partial [Nowakowskiella sp. JEL0078]
MKLFRLFSTTSKSLFPRRSFGLNSISNFKDTTAFKNLREKFGNYDLILPSTELLFSKPTNFNSVDVRSIKRPEYADGGQPHLSDEILLMMNLKKQNGVRSAGRLAAEILQYAGSLAVPGVTTLEIDAKVHAEITRRNAYPSPLNYFGFPKSICTSINNVLCHGIPDTRKLVDGDIINIDITVYLSGPTVALLSESNYRYHGDTSATFLIGNVDEKGRELVAITKESMDAAISICGPGVPLTEIGKVISAISKKHGFSVSNSFCGHGIGKYFHEPPLIFHHENNEDGKMEVGMSFTIEPVLCQGSQSFIKWPDNWTVVTTDGGRSAQFEHTVLIVENGVEILTSI